MRSFVPLALLAAFAVIAASCADPEPPAEEVPAQVHMGNGRNSWIVTEGATREGAIFTFPEVVIDQNGWLVMHPFENGKPKGEVYVGASYLAAGKHSDVTIAVESAPEPGDMFIVMLHYDVNDDQTFDFVFVDERNVLDKAVFEGTKMIAHRFAAP